MMELAAREPKNLGPFSCLEKRLPERLKTLICGNKTCPRPLRVFPHTGAGRTPKFCSVGCRKAHDRDRKRGEYFPAAEQQQIVEEAQSPEGYWTTEDGSLYRDAPPYLESVPLEALDLPATDDGDDLPEYGFGFDLSENYSASDGLRPSRWLPNGDYVDDRPYDEKVDQRYPLDKVWADEGANLPAPGDRAPHGGPYRHRDPGWIPVDEWLSSLEDDGRAWVNGRSVNPANMV